MTVATVVTQVERDSFLSDEHGEREERVVHRYYSMDYDQGSKKELNIEHKTDLSTNRW